MTDKLITSLKKLALNIGVTNGQSTEEIFTQFLQDQKRINLIERIKVIRQSGWYTPDYNKPKVFTDVKILFNSTPSASTSTFEPISFDIKTTCERPVDFGNDMEKWLSSNRANNLMDSESKKKKELEFQMVMQERYENVNKFFNKFLKVE